MPMIDGIRRAMQVGQFRPFTLHMVDGTDYLITRRDFLLIPPGRNPREVYFYTPIAATHDEYMMHWINLTLVQSMTFPPGSEPQQVSQADGKT